MIDWLIVIAGLFDGFSKKAAITSPNIKSVSVGERIKLPGGRLVCPFLTTHRVPSNGYLICKEEKSLKAEFGSLSGPEIGAQATAGTIIHESTVVPEIAYTGIIDSA